MEKDKLINNIPDSEPAKLPKFLFGNNKSNIVNIISSLTILLLLVITDFKDIITILTLGLGSFIIFSMGTYLLVLKYKQIKINERIPTILIFLGASLLVFGMFFGRFSAVFRIPTPFGYYFFLSLIVTIVILISMSKFIKVI